MEPWPPPERRGRDEIADKPQTLMRRAGPAVTAFRWNGVSINNACVV